MRRPLLFLLTCALAVAWFATPPADAINVVVGSEVFGDEFAGNPNSTTLDALKWTFDPAEATGTASVLVNSGSFSGTNVEIYSAGASGGANAHISSAAALNFSASPNDWWAQVVFKFPANSGKWIAPNSGSARQYNILSGQDAISATLQGNNQGFDLRAVRVNSGVNAGSGRWALAWNGIDGNTARVADILDDSVEHEGFALSTEQTYAVSVHRKSDNTVDIYFDKTAGDGSASDFLINKPLLGPSVPANPVGLTSGDWSSTVAGYLLVDAVRIGTGPALTGQPGDFNNDDQVDSADYVVWRKTMPGITVKYDEWRSNFGNLYGSGSGSGAGLTSSSVPEPTAALLLAIGAGVWSAVFGRARSSKHAWGRVLQ